MTNPRRIHVTQQQAGNGWQTKREGSPSASSIHSTQKAAIEQATLIAKFERGEVVIHGRDGRIRDADSYGSDPFPPRDRKH